MNNILAGYKTYTFATLLALLHLVQFIWSPFDAQTIASISAILLAGMGWGIGAKIDNRQ